MVTPETTVGGGIVAVADGTGVLVLVGVAVGEPGVLVMVGVLVLVGVGVIVGVLVGPQLGNWTEEVPTTPQLPTLIGPKVTVRPRMSVKLK